MCGKHRPASRAFISAIVAAVVLVSAQIRSPQAAGAPQIPQALQQRAQQSGHVRVIVEVISPSGSFVPEGALSDGAEVIRQRQTIATLQTQLLAKLSLAPYRVVHRYQTVPYVALDVSAGALAALESTAPGSITVRDDAIVRPVLAQSVPLIEGDQVWAQGYDGTGQMIAILDTGVDSTHPFLAGKVIEEACYSSTVPGTSQTLCPNGLEVQIGPGAAVPCPLTDCFHGTHVAGIAAGNGATGDVPFSGVAKGAQLMAVQVFSQINDPVSCGGSAPCAGAFSSDIIAALERVYALAWEHNFSSVNLSLGGASFAAPCDSEPYKPMIDNLRAIGIATVAAAGNDGSTTEISTPACISSAISVGSTSKTDVVSWFSNVAPFLSLFAPGESITSSIPGGGYEALSGTSMATPHVAGVWALLKQASPGASVTTILNALQATGLPITDTRFLGTATIPRVRAFEALATLVPITNPAPVVSSLSPTNARAGSPGVSVTVTGSGFDAFSVVNWNGTPRPTTVISTEQIQAAIPASDLSLAGTALVTVTAPTPGGGTSTALTFTITPPPALAVSAATVAPGGTETVTLTNGFGGAGDWLALAATGAPVTGYVQYTYVATGTTTTTWTVTMPTTPGTYEFRYFPSYGYTVSATSPTVTVTSPPNPAPVISSLSPAAAVVGGPAFTLTVTGSGFVASSVVRWNGAARPTTVINAGQLQAAIGAGDIAALGSVPVTVFTPPPSGGVSTSLTFTVSPPPSITVSATTVAGGSSVTMTLTNGFGGAGDWLALAATGAPTTSYLQYTYVGAGVTTRAWTVTMPATPGTYEFRLFPNNGYTSAATSPTVTVSSPTTQAPIVSSLSPTGTTVGGPAFTLTVNGSGFVASSVVIWNGATRPTTVVNASQLQAAIGASDIAVAGTAQVAVYTPPPGGGTSSALPFAIGTPPSLAVSANSVNAAASVTVTLTNGLGGSGDWLALAATGSPSTSYLLWTYVGAGVTTRTWTVTMPAAPGTYEFRLFLNNGYGLGATSAPVSVVAGQPPALAVNATSVKGGSSVTMTLTNGLGGSGDWLALAATGSPSTSYLLWTYIGAGVTTRTWTVTMPTAPATYEFRLFPNNGYTLAATSPPVTVTP